MNTPARVPQWLPPLSLMAIAVLIGITYVLPSWKYLPFTIPAQAFLLIIALRGFCYWPPMRRLVAGMPIAHRVVFIGLIAAMIAGHYTIRTDTFFPYVAWEIFPVAREDDPVTCREFIATTGSGKKVRLLVEQLFPSIVQFNPPYDAVQLEELVDAMARAYNEHHADDPVLHVDLMLMAVPLHPPAGEIRSAPSCEFLNRYDISSGQ